MKFSLSHFLYENKIIILSMVIGAIVAYFYWKYFGIYWGTYPLSSECWVNCIYGGLFSALLSCIFLKEEKNENDRNQQHGHRECS